jgi:hypothetical protein
MLFFTLSASIALRVFFNDKKGRTLGGVGQQGDKFCISARGNKLLGAVYFISGDFASII